MIAYQLVLYTNESQHSYICHALSNHSYDCCAQVANRWDQGSVVSLLMFALRVHAQSTQGICTSPGTHLHDVILSPRVIPYLWAAC